MKYALVALFVCVVLVKDALAKKSHKKHHNHNKSNGHKIVGGYDADIKDYPYQAFLLLTKEQPDDTFGCGGAIISTSYILSAAHCFVDGVRTVQAKVGSTDKFFGGQDYPGTFTVHENYDHISKDFDIAYVKTDKEMDLDGVNAKVIQIIEKGSSIPSGSMLKLSGWGDTSEGGTAPETLKAVEVPSLSNEECNEKQTVTERQFCGGYEEGGKDTCQGDSGGPVVIADSGILGGVVSAGYGCARPHTPGIYTNLTDPPIRSWIMEHTGV